MNSLNIQHDWLRWTTVSLAQTRNQYIQV